jgi:hypothetical protein
MVRACVTLASSALLVGCCFTPPVPTPIAPPPATTVVQGGGPRLPSTSPAEAVPIALGFPDPFVAHGVAGGTREASTFGPECRGRVQPMPNHRFRLESSFPYLRIMARGDRDLTLVVRTPGGISRCNDDSDGLNPVVEGAFEPGIYDVYVGMYSGDELSPYDLGLSVNASTTPSTLLSTTPTAIGTTLRSGTLTVAEVEGTVVAAGDVCTFSEVSIPPSSGGFDARWTITCGAQVLYGAGDSGYGRITDPSWPPGTVAYDRATTVEDTDPALEWTRESIVLRDDASGPFGAYRIRFADPASAP